MYSATYPLNGTDGGSMEVALDEVAMSINNGTDSLDHIHPEMELLFTEDGQDTSVAMETGGLDQLRTGIMDSGSHSSEEELEEYYLSPVGSGKEKRKWSELSQSEESYCSDADYELTWGIGGPRLSSSTTPSGGERVHQMTPNLVQFSTSPPLHVHKPKRSISPQCKVLSQYNQERSLPEQQGYNAAKRPNRRHDSMNDLPVLKRQEERKERRANSPRKRSVTSRVCRIQRPCLDFEKMQQSNQEQQPCT